VNRSGSHQDNLSGLDRRLHRILLNRIWSEVYLEMLTKLLIWRSLLGLLRWQNRLRLGDAVSPPKGAAKSSGWVPDPPRWSGVVPLSHNSYACVGTRKNFEFFQVPIQRDQTEGGFPERLGAAFYPTSSMMIDPSPPCLSLIAPTDTISCSSLDYEFRMCP
jgi:hypothetical protein